jgi:hypothetical protein
MNPVLREFVTASRRPQNWPRGAAFGHFNNAEIELWEGHNKNIAAANICYNS